MQFLIQTRKKLSLNFAPQSPDLIGTSPDTSPDVSVLPFRKVPDSIQETNFVSYLVWTLAVGFPSFRYCWRGMLWIRWVPDDPCSRNCLPPTCNASFLCSRIAQTRIGRQSHDCACHCKGQKVNSSHLVFHLYGLFNIHMPKRSRKPKLWFVQVLLWY